MPFKATRPALPSMPIPTPACFPFRVIAAWASFSSFRTSTETLLGQVLNQSPVERPREMGSRMPSVA